MHLRKIEDMADFCEELSEVITPDTEYDQLSDDDMKKIDKAHDLIKSVYDSVFYNVDYEDDEMEIDEELMERVFFDLELEEEEKKLDPVGKADADIDNDGDVDDSDDYLHNRRKTIKKAIKNTKEK